MTFFRTDLGSHAYTHCFRGADKWPTMCPVQTHCIVLDRQGWEKKGNLDPVSLQILRA